MRSRIVLIAGLILILALPLGGRSQDDTDTDQVSIRLFIEETVVVFVRGCREQRVDLDVADLELERYVSFPCTLGVVTGALTDYELRLAAEALVQRGAGAGGVQPIEADPLEIRLLEEGMTGLACPPSPKRVEVNPRVVEFIPVVELPDSLLLFTGCNNTANPTTTAPLEARVDLTRLPGEVLATGSQVVFTLSFIVIER